MKWTLTRIRVAFMDRGTVLLDIYSCWIVKKKCFNSYFKVKNCIKMHLKLCVKVDFCSKARCRIYLLDFKADWKKPQSFLMLHSSLESIFSHFYSSACLMQTMLSHENNYQGCNCMNATFYHSFNHVKSKY